MPKYALADPEDYRGADGAIHGTLGDGRQDIQRPLRVPSSAIGSDGNQKLARVRRERGIRV